MTPGVDFSIMHRSGDMTCVVSDCDTKDISTDSATTEDDNRSYQTTCPAKSSVERGCPLVVESVEGQASVINKSENIPSTTFRDENYEAMSNIRNNVDYHIEKRDNVLGCNPEECHQNSFSSLSSGPSHPNEVLPSRKSEMQVIPASKYLNHPGAPRAVSISPMGKNWSVDNNVSTSLKIPPGNCSKSQTNAITTDISISKEVAGVANHTIPSLAATDSSVPIKNAKKIIPVFDHVLLLPLSHHRATKEAAIPSNYLTPEEEAEQEVLRCKARKERVLEPQKDRVNNGKREFLAISQTEESKENTEIGRSGRIRKKPRLFADYVTEKSNQSIDENENVQHQSSYDYESEEGEEEEEELYMSEDETDDYSSSSSSKLFPISKESSQSRVYGTKYSNDEKGDAYWNKQVKSLKRFKEVYGHTR